MSNDNEEPLSASILNYRVDSSLNGFSVAGASDIAQNLIELLRSPHEIERGVREEIARALERGRFRESLVNEDGHSVPRISIENVGLNGRLSAVVLKRREWLDAAELVQDLVGKGMEVGVAKTTIAASHSLGIDKIDKAWKLWNRFHRELQDANSVLHEDIERFNIGFETDSDDYFYLARSCFIDRVAASEVSK